MVIWSGWGLLGLVIPAVTVFLTTFLASAALGSRYLSTHNWPIGLGIILGAGLVYLLSVKLDAPGRMLVDPATGQRVILKRRDTLFWIPLRWIALIVAVFGLIMLLASSTTST